mgnify:CR=1 FL=1
MLSSLIFKIISVPGHTLGHVAFYSEKEKIIFDNLDLNDKYNKNTFYSTVRDYTNLQTKDIRNAMKRYKKLYNLIKQ